jgi:hypothetical protein
MKIKSPGITPGLKFYLLFKEQEDYFFFAAFLGEAFFAAFFGAAFLGAAFFAAFFAVAMFLNLMVK